MSKRASRTASTMSRGAQGSQQAYQATSAQPIRAQTLAKLRSYRLRRSLAPLVEQLGGLQAVYAGPRTPFWPVLLGPFCILFGLLILFAFWQNYTLLFSWWPRTQIGLLLALSAIWLLVGFLLTGIAVFYARLRILVCADGLIVMHRKTTPFTWSRVAQFWKSIKVKDNATITRTYRIHTTDNQSFVFNDELPDVGRLGHIIERRVTRARLPELLDAYYAGHPVSFEQLTLQSAGIFFQQHIPLREKKRQAKQQRQQQVTLLPWDDLDAISIDDTNLNVYKKGQYWDWLTLPVADIPNAHLLKTMIDTITQERRYGPLQRNIALFQEKIPITFGDIRISKQGIDIERGKLSFSWSELDGIGVGEQEVIIKRKGAVEEWYGIPLWRVRNAAQLKDFVDCLLQTNAL